MAASYLRFHISHTGSPCLPLGTPFEGELRSLEGNMDRTQTHSSCCVWGRKPCSVSAGQATLQKTREAPGAAFG